jgi:hypothetical protein
MILALAVFGISYALFYYGANILESAYLRTTPMNPAPLSVLLGIPGAGANSGQNGPNPATQILNGTAPSSQAPVNTPGAGNVPQILNPGG